LEAFQVERTAPVVIPEPEPQPKMKPVLPEIKYLGLAHELRFGMEAQYQGSPQTGYWVPAIGAELRNLPGRASLSVYAGRDGWSYGSHMNVRVTTGWNVFQEVGAVSRLEGDGSIIRTSYLQSEIVFQVSYQLSELLTEKDEFERQVQSIVAGLEYAHYFAGGGVRAFLGAGVGLGELRFWNQNSTSTGAFGVHGGISFKL